MLSAKMPVGLLEPPGLNISGLKSFAPESEGQWVYQAFNGDGIKRLVHLRLYYGGLLHVSDLLDVSSVKYYYSDKPLDNVPEQLVPFVQGRDLFVYKNIKAWDYYYLARKVVGYNAIEDIRDPVKGEVYVGTKDALRLPKDFSDGQVRLKIFEPGRMVFDFNGNEDAFLVVADGWHPFWKASAQGENVEVMKVNGIFKGVRLKPGHYDVEMHFDNSPYRLGITISIIAWLCFITLCFWSVQVRKI
jgi:hypothetical protein